jgi:2-polyprenyl-3-methyl-5-hydroxy-6-metoxy-1,4-benzoquinol methylase
MADFRRAAYERYVSAFKADIATREGRALRWYMRWCEYTYRPFLDALPEGGHVLDLGCGSGDFMRLLASRRLHAEGIDISGEQVRLASKAGLAAYEADAFEFLTTHRETYDGIVALDLIEHFRRDELLRLLEEIRLALKPGGRLLIQTPNGEGLFASQIIYGDLTHMTILNPSSLRQALKLTGFGNITIREARPAPIGVRSRVRSVAWPVVRAGAKLVRYAESPRARPVLTENMVGIAHRDVGDSPASR